MRCLNGRGLNVYSGVNTQSGGTGTLERPAALGNSIVGIWRRDGRANSARYSSHSLSKHVRN